jgi:hypothetical protein
MEEFSIQTIINDIQNYMRKEMLICHDCEIEIPEGERHRTLVPHYYGETRARQERKYFWWGHFKVNKACFDCTGSYAATIFEPATDKSKYRLAINFKVQGKWKDFRIYDPEFR